MSIKTLHKRIALVAVSALGVGLLSVAPASADTEPGAISRAFTNADLYPGVIADLALVGGDNAQDVMTATITTASSLKFTVLAAGVGTLGYATVTNGTFVGATSGATFNSSGSTVVSNANNTAIVGLVVRPAGTGAMVIKTYAGTPATATLVDTATVTVVAASSVGSFDVSTSAARLNTTNGGSAATYTDVATANLRANGAVGYIDYSINDANGNNMPTTTLVSASATNGALISFVSAAAAVTSATFNSTGAPADGTIYVVQPTANAPVSTTVTISVNGAVWTSKSLTIVGDVASIKVVPFSIGEYKSALNGTGTLLVYAYDSASNQVARTVSAVGSLYDSVVSATTATVATSASTYAAATFTCVNRGSAKAQYYIVNTQLKTILSNVADVKCAGSPYSYTASLDKATYKPGEIATLTIVAKDSKGNLVNGTVDLGDTVDLDLAPAIAGTQMTPVTTPAKTDTFTDADGTKTYKFIVGTTEGSYQMLVNLPAWTDANKGSNPAVTIPYTVSSGVTGVTNAEVLAAIVKLIASINTQIAKLQKLIKKK
jgi:hypothetical protein